jgi:rod shape-determining protein MreD
VTRLRTLMPVATVALLTIAAVLPWGLSSANRLTLPLLPVVAIYFWTLDRDAWLPEWSIFLAGLLLDLLTQGPLGYWALVYLVAYVITVLCSRLRIETVTKRLLVFAGAIVAITIFAWLAASVYLLEVLEWEPYARGAGAAVFAAVVLTFAAMAFMPSGTPGRQIRLARGE